LSQLWLLIVQQVENSVWAKYTGGPRGQKSVWVTADTAHMVPAPDLGTLALSPERQSARMLEINK